MDPQSIFKRTYLPDTERLEALDQLAEVDPIWANELICQTCSGGSDEDICFFVQCIYKPYITLETLICCMPNFLHSQFGNMIVTDIIEKVIAIKDHTYMSSCISALVRVNDYHHALILVQKFSKTCNMDLHTWYLIKGYFKYFNVDSQKLVCKILYKRHLDTNVRIHIVHYSVQKFAVKNIDRTIDLISHDIKEKNTSLDLTLALEFVFLYDRTSQLLQEIMKEFFMFNRVNYFKTLLLYKQKLLDGKAMDSLIILRNINMDDYLNFLSEYLYKQFEVCVSVRDRIIYGQQIIELLPKYKNLVMDDLSKIAQDETLSENERADACDVIIHHDSQRGLQLLAGIRKGSTVLYDDSQNIHNFIVDYAVKKSLKILMRDNPIMDIQLVIKQVEKVAEQRLNKQKLQYLYEAIQRIQVDCINHSKDKAWLLSTVFIRIWEEIVKSDCRETLENALLDELVNMSGTCSSGHIGRLLNIFTGLHPTLGIQVDWKTTIYDYLLTEFRNINKDNDELSSLLYEQGRESSVVVETRDILKQKAVEFYTHDLSLEHNEEMDLLIEEALVKLFGF